MLTLPPAFRNVAIASYCLILPPGRSSLAFFSINFLCRATKGPSSRQTYRC